MKTSLGILGGMLALQVLLVLGFVAVAARNRSVVSANPIRPKSARV